MNWYAGYRHYRDNNGNNLRIMSPVTTNCTTSSSASFRTTKISASQLTKRSSKLTFAQASSAHKLEPSKHSCWTMVVMAGIPHLSRMQQILLPPKLARQLEKFATDSTLNSVLMGPTASRVGTPHANAYKVESLWQKAWTEFPDAHQAATKIAVEDARA